MPSRRVLLRFWFAGLVGLLATTLVASVGRAETLVTISNLTPTDSGWYLDRDPAITDPAFDPGRPGGGASEAWAADHIFVGWDGTDKTRPEYIAAVSFDLFQIGVPDDAVITQFEITLIEHESVDPKDKSHNTPNFATAISQGVVACAMPGFISGGAAEALSRAPKRECAGGPDGIRNSNPVSPGKFAWKFDLTTLASSLKESKSNIGFSFEPKPLATQNQTWTLAFHDETFQETVPPATTRTPAPGILATLSYTIPDEIEPPTGGNDETTETTNSEFGLPDFGDSGGLVTELSAGEEPPPAPVVRKNQPTLLAGAAEGKSASFWDIPLFAWALGLFSLMTLGASGWLLQMAPPTHRLPGAASALMSGHDFRKDSR